MNKRRLSGFIYGLLWSMLKNQKRAFDSDFKESDHNRAKNGQFAPKNGSSVTVLNQYKYEKQAPESEIKRIKAKYPIKEPSDKQKAARVRFHHQLDEAWTNQSPKAKSTLDQVKINEQGFSEFPALPHSTCKTLGLKVSKKVGLPLESYQRILAKHPDLDKEIMRKGLALCFYGDIKREVLPVRKNNAKHFIAQLKENTFGDVVIDIEEVKDHYEIVHFHKIVK